MSQTTGSSRLEVISERVPRSLVIVLAIVIGLLVLALRKGPAVLSSFFWAEDATVFYLQERTPGPDLFSAYAGQMWIMQRALAWVLGWVQSVPLSMTLYYLASVAVTVLGSAVILQRRATAVFRRFRFQLIGFAGLLLVPAVAEVQGNLANVHVWAATSVMLCLSFPEPRSRWGKTAEVLWILAVALSGFTSAVLLPVAAWGVLRFRSRWASVRAGLILGSLAIASTVWLTSDRPVSTGGGYFERLSTALQTLPGRVGGALIAGEQSGPDVWRALSVGLLLLVLLVAVVGGWDGVATVGDPVPTLDIAAPVAAAIHCWPLLHGSIGGLPTDSGPGRSPSHAVALRRLGRHCGCLIRCGIGLHTDDKPRLHRDRDSQRRDLCPISRSPVRHTRSTVVAAVRSAAGFVRVIGHRRRTPDARG
jgi:hypothetical protein